MSMLPAIDLLHGQAVRLAHGKRDTARVVGDPLSLAKDFKAKGIPMIHVVDLEGAFEGEPRHLDILRTLSDILPVQYGGGLRTPEHVQQAFDAGASRVMVGTLLFKGMEIPHRDRVVASLDVKGGIVVTHGWQTATPETLESALRRFLREGYSHFLCTSVDKDGSLQGPRVPLYREARRVLGEGPTLIAAGGIRSWQDVHACLNAGATSVVVGMALYTGNMSLEAS